jgi:hypothetical protein
VVEWFGRQELTPESIKKIDHALFGYAEGHRQLASTVRLPSQDMYHLGAASDLASDVRLDPTKSYLTGLPLVESQRYALIRTWAAPEMPRPGCVWSHVLLLDEAILSSQLDLSIFFELFQNPRQVDRAFFTEPLSLETSVSNLMPPPVGQIAEVIFSYYSHRPTFINSGGRAEAIEAVIAAVWSQQWPRLRMEFSFRTAQLGSRRRRNARYDVQVAPVEPSEEDYVSSKWSETAAADAAGGRVTPLRRFLWRYGRDVRDPRDRFRLLVETFLEAAAIDHLPMKAAVRVFDELKGEDDGAILKNDILGLDTSSVSICPPVSFLDMLRLLDATGSEEAVDIVEIGQRFKRLSDAEVTEVADFAFAGANGIHQLRDSIIGWTVARANDEIVNSVKTPALRLQILTLRPALITARAIAEMSGEELVRLFTVCETTEMMKTLTDVAVRRDLGQGAANILTRAPALAGESVIAAARAKELNSAWLHPIESFRDALLKTNLLQHAEGLSDLTMIARLTGLSRSVFPLGQTSANWASRWPGLRRDLPEQEILDIEADLFTSGLSEASPDGWNLIAVVLPELRVSINKEPLGGDARQTLDRSLPGIGYDNWDLNRRILLALHALRKKIHPADRILSQAGLSDVESDFVIHGPEEKPKRKSNIFWWLD